MIAFIAISLAAVAAVFAWLWRPFWRQRAGAVGLDAQSINTAIYRDQLARLDQDVAEGHLSEQDRDAARTELQRRALDDTAAAGHAAVTGSAVQAPNKALTLAAGMVLVFAAGIYVTIGSPTHLVHPGSTGPQTVTNSDGQQLDLEQMVAKLAEKMEKNPTDLKGWSMLGLSYKVMGRFEESEKAFERAGSFIDDDARMLAAYADVAAANRNGDFSGKPNALIAKALKVDPNHGLALWLAGTASLKAGKPNDAIATWNKLMAQLPPGSEDAKMLQGAIDDAVSQGGKAPAALAPATKTATDSGARQATANSDAGQAVVQGEVSLAPAVQAKLPAQATLLVIARRPGERMPLAVLRVPAAKLPYAFTLDDSLAMSPTNKLSSVSEVEVLARLSQSGQAAAQAGDLYSATQTVKLGSKNLKLSVDQVQP